MNVMNWIFTLFLCNSLYAQIYRPGGTWAGSWVTTRPTTRFTTTTTTSTTTTTTTTRTTTRSTTTPRTTTTEASTFLPKGLKKLIWISHLNNATLLLSPEKYPEGFDQEKEYFIGFRKPDTRFQTCTTYSGARGRCRYLEYCASDEYLQSIDAFLADACLIGLNFMGVCCLNVESPSQSTAGIVVNSQSKIKYYNKGLTGLAWKNHISNSSLVLSPELYPDGFDQKRQYNLGIGKPNSQFQECITYTGGFGRCRYLEYCARDDYLQSLESFLADACLIGQNHIGVCCLENAGIRQITATQQSILDTESFDNENTAQRPSESNKKVTCGSQQVELTRIVGGQVAEEGEWPWMASIIRYRTRHVCGGVLITDQHVLTASHCFATQEGNSTANVTIRLGEHDFRKRSNNEKDFQVQAIYVPKPFNRRTLKDDIAIAKLKEKVRFTDYIQPICLPPSNIILAGQSAYVAGCVQPSGGQRGHWFTKSSMTVEQHLIRNASFPVQVTRRTRRNYFGGWGAVKYGGETNSLLLKALLPIWNQTSCQETYTRLTISDTQLCAGYKEGGLDSCQGDSGGPLMYRSSGGRWSLIGTVSVGRGCGEQGYPGVYTRISSYLDWIKSTVLDDSFN